MTVSLPESVSPQPPTRVRLRALRAEDLDAVLALLARHGHPARSRAGLQWALIDNPSRVSLGAEAGWVLEDAQTVVGFIGNLPLRVLVDGLAVWCAGGTTPVVDALYRAHGIRLVRAFASQPDAAFVHLRPTTEPLALALDSLQFEPAEGQADSTHLRWTVQQGSHWGLGTGSNSFQVLWRWARRLARAESSTEVAAPQTELRVQRLTADELAGVCPSHWPQTWNAWANRYWSRPGLWTERSAYLMSWRLSDPDLANRLALWAVQDCADQMLGMVLALQGASEAGDPGSAELLDWAVLPQAPAQASSLLLQAVKAWARSWKANSVDALGFNGEAARQLTALGPQDLSKGSPDLLVLSKTSALPTSHLPLSSWTCSGSEQADWFYTDLNEAPQHTTVWHPARACRPRAQASAAAGLTSSAAASQ